MSLENVQKFKKVIEFMNKMKKKNEKALKFKKLSEHATIPKYQTPGSSGFDFHACLGEAVHIIGPGDRSIIPTGLSCEIPKGHEIQIRPRSGMAAKFGITVLNTPGTIDEDYRDEIKIILINTDKRKEISINNGDRIAQGVLCSVTKADICEIEEFSKEAKDNDRGGGFGSTGQ